MPAADPEQLLPLPQDSPAMQDLLEGGMDKAGAHTAWFTAKAQAEVAAGTCLATGPVPSLGEINFPLYGAEG